jgi:hypothetical protein
MGDVLSDLQCALLVTTWAEAPPTTGEGDEELVAAGGAADAGDRPGRLSQHEAPHEWAAVAAPEPEPWAAAEAQEDEEALVAAAD